MTATTNPTTEQRHVEKAGRDAPAGARGAQLVWGVLRIALGWVFLWAFLDKLFGLGFNTERDAAWINGGSPTEGFLTFGTSGPLEGFYQSFAGAAWADTLFMLGLAALGVALMAGIGLRVAAVAGTLMMVMMWSAALPPDTNPFLTYHLIYAGMMIAFALGAAGDTLGFGRVWARTPLVRRVPWLR